MRTIGTLVFLVCACGRPQPAPGNGDAGAADASGSDAGSALVRVHYPAGERSVTLRGSGAGLDWSQGKAMSLGADDVWSFAVAGLSAPIEWKPLLDDDTWARGPNYHLAPGETLDVFPHFSTVNGTVTRLFTAFASTALGNTREVWVYLPPAYLENGRAREPVLYMHDGQNLFDPALAFGGVEWNVDETFDAAAEHGTCDGDGSQICGNDGDCPGSACHTFPEAIVIGVANTSARIDEYTPTYDASVGAGGKGGLYLQMLSEELKPAVDAALRTLPDVDHTLMAGSSLGGVISSYAGLLQPLVWGRIGAMSPSTWWDDKYLIGAVQGSQGAPARPALVYLDCGDSGPSNDGVDDTRVLAQTYQAIGYVEGVDFHFVVGAGDQHNEHDWSRRFPGAMRFLLGKRR